MKTKYLYLLLKRTRLGRGGLLAVAVMLSVIVAACAAPLNPTAPTSPDDLAAPQAASLSQSQDVAAISDPSITVNSTADTVNSSDGLCTLREAIRAANSNTASGAVSGECGAGSSTVTDMINFSVTGIIKLASTLPLINSVMTIDGIGQSVTISGEGKVRVFSVPAAGKLNLKTLTIANGFGVSDGLGGGILNRGGVITISNSTFVNNQGGSGGAISDLNQGSTISIEYSTFINNRASVWGGAIYSGASTSNSKPTCKYADPKHITPDLTIKYSTFTGNFAGRRGGAILVNDCPWVTIIGSTFNKNEARHQPGPGSGGAIDTLGVVNVVNSTFSQNLADAGGGAIRNGSGGTLSVTNSTFSGNSATPPSTTCCGGGALHNAGGSIINLSNTIIANSSNGGNCRGNITDLGGNLTWPATDTTCPGKRGDPKLGGLAPNGGPTETMAIPRDSPAVDKGVPAGADCTDHPFSPQLPQVLVYDQRGFPRRVDGDGNGIPTCDIGAYEFGPALTTSAITGVLVGEKIHDTATIKDLIDPAGTGKITFTLYSDAACTTQVFTYTTPRIPGDGSYPSGDYTTTSAGNYYWIASYSGDGNNNLTATDCGDPGEISVVNVPPTATLIVKKHVINDNGGTSLADDFTITVTGNNPKPPSFPGDENGTIVTLNPGAYSVSETGPSGYSASFSAECNGSVAAGEKKYCFIENNDQTAHLTLSKTVVNDSGGTATCSDFTLRAAGPTPLSGQCKVEGDVNAGTYNLSETGPSGYNASDWACEGGNQIDGDTVELGLGDVITCALTNNDQPPQTFITVVKNVTNDDGGSAAPDDFKLTLDGKPVLSDVRVPVNPGTHTAGETLLPGYNFEGFGGDCDSNGNVTVAVGESKICTLRNNDQPPPQAFITVIKDVINDDGGSAAPDDFKLTLDGKSVLSGVSVPVDPGTHKVGETLLPGYNFEGFAGDCDSDGNVTVSAGDDKTCTLTNNDISAPPIKVTGGGQIQVPNPTSRKEATFGFNADQTEAGSTAATGRFNYVNHDTGLHINGSVTEIQVIASNPDGSPKTVQFSGTCDGNGPACTFVVTVEDHGEPGTSDEFGITITGDVNESQSQRVISKGNIQFHFR